MVQAADGAQTGATPGPARAYVPLCAVHSCSQPMSSSIAVRMRTSMR